MSTEIKGYIFLALAGVGVCLVFIGLWWLDPIAGTIATGVVCIIAGIVGVVNVS